MLLVLYVEVKWVGPNSGSFFYIKGAQSEWQRSPREQDLSFNLITARAETTPSLGAERKK